MLPSGVSTKIKPIDAKTIPGIATTHFHDEKNPRNHRISHNEDPTRGPRGRPSRLLDLKVTRIRVTLWSRSGTDFGKF